MLTTIKSITALAKVRHPDDYRNSESNSTARDVVDVSWYVSTAYYYEIDQ
jgi:hypothetical protein